MKAWSLLLPIVIGLHVFAQTPCNTSGPVPFEDHEKWGYLSARGIVIPARFDLAGLFTADGAIACVANQCGLLGRDGSFVAPTWNRQSRPFPENYAEDLAAVRVNGRVGFMDNTGSVVIEAKYEDVYPFSMGSLPWNSVGCGHDDQIAESKNNTAGVATPARLDISSGID